MGYDGTVSGLDHPTKRVREGWSTFVGLQGGVSDVQMYDYALTGCVMFPHTMWGTS